MKLIQNYTIRKAWFSVYNPPTLASHSMPIMAIARRTVIVIQPMIRTSFTSSVIIASCFCNQRENVIVDLRLN